MTVFVCLGLVAVGLLHGAKECQCLIQTACDSTIPSTYILNVSETDPVGTHLKFRVSVGTPGSSWELEVRKPSFGPYTSALKRFVESALTFEPNGGQRQEGLKCSHSDQTDFCDLKLAKVMDVEMMRDKYRSLPPHVFEVKARCSSQTPHFVWRKVDVYLVLREVNEFVPTFANPQVMVEYHIDKLVEGFVIYDLYRQAEDQDADRVRPSTYYKLTTNNNVAALVGSRLVLKTKVNSQSRLIFRVNAVDRVPPHHESTLRLTLNTTR